MPRTIALFALLALFASSPARSEPLGSLVDEADVALKKGDPLKASSLFQASLERAQKLPPKLHARALKGMRFACRGLIQQRKLEASVRALVFLLKASKSGPLGQVFEDQVRTDLDQLAFDLVLTGEPRLAIEALKVLMAEGPGPPMRWALLARAHIERGEFEKATQTLKRGLRLHPASPELLFVRAALAGTLSELAVARANYASAESMLQRAAADLQQALEKEPAAAGIHRALGKIRGALWVYYRATGQYNRSVQMLVQAEDSYARASTLEPEDPDVSFELANLLFVAEDWVWAEQTYLLARARYRRLLGSGKLSPMLAQETKRQLESCREAITRCRHKRAIQAAAAGQFARARELVKLAAKDRPAYGAKAKRFLTLLARAQQAHDQLTRRLEDQPDSANAQRKLGDLWTRLGKYEQAHEAYQRAMKAEVDEASRLDLRERLYGVGALPGTTVRVQIGIGELDVVMDLPPDLEPSKMRARLEKAHALTMAVFDHKLIGSLELKVFANKRLFLEQAGVDLGPHQEGLYAFGRVVTFDTPGRSRSKWLDILVHEISHRYVDEMSYNRAPRWLSEGLAQWVSQGWTRAHRSRFERLVRSSELVPWADLETSFAERWDDPRLLNAMYLQAHQIVHWLMRRYGRERVTTLLAALRQGKRLDEASGMAFGADLRRLDKLEAGAALMPFEVLLMAKAPEPGQVKTRLQTLLEPKQLVALQAAFIEDSLANCVTTANLLASTTGDKALPSKISVRLACAPRPEDEYFQRLSRRTGVELLDQGPGDLGERMARLQKLRFEVGALGVIFVGVDTPAMPAGTLRAAAEALRGSSVVLGPAEDGGYYLLGSIIPTPALFTDMPWGTSHVLSLTRERLAADSTIWTELEGFWDVDRPADLMRLADLLEAEPERAPRTARQLAKLEIRSQT